VCDLAARAESAALPARISARADDADEPRRPSPPPPPPPLLPTSSPPPDGDCDRAAAAAAPLLGVGCASAALTHPTPGTQSRPAEAFGWDGLWLELR